MRSVNIKAAIEFYETGYDGIATIYLVNGKRINPLSEVLLHKEPVWIEVRVVSSLCFECVLKVDIGRTTPPIPPEGDLSG